MIDFTKYSNLKKDGSVVLQKVGTRAVVFVRSFDPQSGAENAPAMATVNVSDVLKVREEAQKTLSGIDAFLADVKATGVETSPAVKE